MALIKCPECGNSISSEATNCPHCGCPKSRYARSLCPECGAELSETTTICPQCGCPLDKFKEATSHRHQANGMQTYNMEYETIPVPGFGECIKLFFTNYANFSGRSRRAEFWWVWLAEVIISIPWMCVIIMYLFQSLDDSSPFFFHDGVLFFTACVLYGIVCLAIFLPNCALGVRRMHDIGFSGFVILVNFVPWVGSLIFLVLACLDSKPEENEYGVSPKYYYHK